MPQLLVRNVPEDTFAALKVQAARHGRSVEAEHRALLETALKGEDADWRHKADEMRVRMRGRSNVPSWVLIREDRDSR